MEPVTPHQHDPKQFAGIGAHVEICPHVVFLKPENILFSNHILISDFCWIHGGIHTVIGNFIHIASHVCISGGGVFIMEDFANASAGARLITGSDLVHGEGLSGPTIPAKYRAVSRSYIHVEKHAFLATNVIVHPGVTIGEGAVVGSNSVVTKDIEPWTINFGTPAKPNSTRPRQTIKRHESLIYEEYGVTPLDLGHALSLKKTIKTVPEI